jgi:hypothetical protein
MCVSAMHSGDTPCCPLVTNRTCLPDCVVALQVGGMEISELDVLWAHAKVGNRVRACREWGVCGGRGVLSDEWEWTEDLTL